MSIFFRIGYKPIQRCILLLLSCSFFACSDRHEKNMVLIMAMNENLVSSNKTIADQTVLLYASIDEKLNNPATRVKVQLWYPKIKQIEKLSGDLFSYIEDLRSDLRKEAGLNDKESLRENDKTTINSLFNIKGRGKELAEKLKKYRERILLIDSKIFYAFNDFLLVNVHLSENSERTADYLSVDMPVTAALVMLNKFENDIRIAENKLIWYCRSQSSEVVLHCMDWPSPIIAQSTMCAKPGQEIVITAGFGKFNTAYNQKIEINKEDITMGYDHIGSYKFKARGEPGKHFVPVKITYDDQDGKQQRFEKNVEYMVMDENR